MVFLDDGGVLNDNECRAVEWRRLIGEYLSPRLGGTAEAWGEANRVVFDAQWQRFEVWREQAAPEEWDFFTSGEERQRWLREMCQHVGVTAPTGEGCLRLAMETEEYVLPRVRAAYPGAVDAVRELNVTGYRLSTASGQSSGELVHYLTGMDILSCFSERLYGPDLLRTRKASSLFYERIFADADIAPALAVVVDDSPEAVRWAAEVGARTVLVSSGPAMPAPDATISSLSELSPLLERFTS